MPFVYDNPNLVAPEYRREGDPRGGWGRARTLHLLKHMTRRHLASRYRGSFLGFFWSLLNPVLMMLVYCFVFRYVVRAEVPNVPFPCFFLTAFLAWNCFSVGSGNAGAAVADGGFLIRKAWFPRYVLPLSAVLSNLVNYLVALPMLLAFNAIMGVYPGASILLLPLAVLWLLVIVVGVGFLIAAIAPFFRDMLELVQVLFAAWFFFTPVIYPISFIETRMPPVLLTLYQLNPMVGCVRLLHHVFVGMPAPAGELALSIPATVLLFVAGVWLFQKVSPRLSNASL